MLHISYEQKICHHGGIGKALCPLLDSPIEVGRGDELPTLDTIDGLVYLPGTINLQPFNKLSIEDFRNDWEVNCLGAAQAIQHFPPHFSEGASIVLMSSVAAGMGLPYHASVGAAKVADWVCGGRSLINPRRASTACSRL